MRGLSVALVALLALATLGSCAAGDDSKGADLSEHAVLVYLLAPTDGSMLALDVIEDPLVEAIERANVGEFDGHVIGPDDAVLYMYGPDADALFAAIAPELERMQLPAGSYAVKRYGPPGSDEVLVGLG